MQLQRYREALQSQIPACNRQLSTVPYINSRLSGSTAITALLDGSGLLTVANVGDSRCMLGRVTGGRLQVAALNTDHNPDVPEEAARILACKVRRPASFLLRSFCILCKKQTSEQQATLGKVPPAAGS